jgi:hypothetical protein
MSPSKSGFTVILLPLFSLFTDANLLLQSLDTMRPQAFSLLTAANALSAAVENLPHLDVPACPAKATTAYDKSVPDLADFPPTQVDICWTNSHFEIDFTAHAETSFFVNSSYANNDPIWQYTVMETFIATGAEDPTKYLEFEVAPNNVTWTAFIHNPSKVRDDDAPLETFYIDDPLAAGISAHTVLDKETHIWTSYTKIPLHLFHIEEGHAKGTKWRMNFFRTVTSPEMFPKQLYGAWNPPNKANFHMTPFFGNIELV